MTEWSTTETKTVFGLLERPDFASGVRQIAKTWADLQLLGVHLADGLQALVANHLTKHAIDTAPLARVAWFELAEHYAETLCGVGHDGMVARHLAAGGTL